MLHVGVEDTENSGIPIQMRVACILVLLQCHHDIGVCTRIKGVLSSSKVASCIVDTNDFMLIDPIVYNNQGPPLRIRVFTFVTVILITREPCKKVILELRYKIL